MNTTDNPNQLVHSFNAVHVAERTIQSAVFAGHLYCPWCSYALGIDHDPDGDLIGASLDAEQAKQILATRVLMAGKTLTDHCLKTHHLSVTIDHEDE